MYIYTSVYLDLHRPSQLLGLWDAGHNKCINSHLLHLSVLPTVDLYFLYLLLLHLSICIDRASFLVCGPCENISQCDTSSYVYL